MYLPYAHLSTDSLLLLFLFKLVYWKILYIFFTYSGYWLFVCYML